MRLYDYIDKFIGLEKNASVVYSEISKNTTEKIAAIADTFSKEEIRHMEWLENLKLIIQDRQIEENEELFYLADFSPKSGSDVIEDFGFEKEKDFFLFALQLEKDSIVMYSEFRANFQKDTTEYEFFEKIINEERGHMFFIIKVLHEL